MSLSSELAGPEVARASGGARPASRAPRAVIVDVDPPLASLLVEWLADAGVDAVVADAGWDVVVADAGIEAVGADAGTTTASTPAFDLALVDVPFPRQGGSARLRALARSVAGAPVLALSPTFFAGVAASGTVARELGVAGVLATPVRRDALVAAVRRLLGRSG